MTSPVVVTDPTLIKALDGLGNYDNPQVDILCGDWHGLQPQFALPTISERNITVRLQGNQAYSEIAFTVLGPDRSKLQTRVSDVWYNRNGVELVRCRVKGIVAERTDTNYQASVSSEDYRSILSENRIFQRDLSWKVPTPIEQIVLEVFNHTQQQNGGDLGIVRASDYPSLGSNAPTGLKAGGAGPLLLVAKKGSTIGEFMNILARSRSADNPDQQAFDWDIDPDLKLHLWVPGRGFATQDTPHAILSYPGNVTNYSIQDGGDGYANEIILYGGSPSTLQMTGVTSNVATTPEGRWELKVEDSNLVTDALVRAAAPGTLQRANITTPTFNVTLAANSWRGPGHIWVGDYVPILINDTYEKWQVIVRVTEMRISYTQANVETVEVTLSRPVDTFRNIVRKINARLKKRA